MKQIITRPKTNYASFILDMCQTDVFFKASCVTLSLTHENKLPFIKILVSINGDRISNASVLPLYMLGKPL